MTDISKLSTPTDRRYTARHIWVRPDGERLLAGITDFAQDQLGEVVYLDLPEAGARFAADEPFGTVESMKSVSELYMPVAGEIVEVNPALEDTPDLVNSGPYEAGWIVAIRPDAGADESALLDAAGYLATLPAE